MHRCFAKKVQAAIETSKAGQCVHVQSTRHSTFSLLKSLTHQRSPALRSTLSVPRPFNLCHCDLQLYSTGLKATQGWLIARSTGWRVLLIDLTTGKSLKFWLAFERFENSESWNGLLFDEERRAKERWRRSPSPGSNELQGVECARRTRRPVRLAKKIDTVVVTSNFRTHA